MKIHNNIDDLRQARNTIVTTGTFDGLHLGHTKIVKRLVALAAEKGGESVLLTFDPHPRKVLFPSLELKLLTLPEEKIKILESYGIDHLIIHPFNNLFSRKTAIEFVRDILVNRLHTKWLVIGHNHQFGRNREGTFDTLKEYATLYGFDVEQVEPEMREKKEISSSKIRNALLKGDIKEATDFLGYDYSVSGTVVEGDHVGHELGFPTANLKPVCEEKLIPANGVYAVRVVFDNRNFSGMMNIGLRPTVKKKTGTTSDVVLEVNLFDFNDDLYGKEIKVMFIDRIRDEKKFAGKEELKKQILSDKNRVQKILSEW